MNEAVMSIGLEHAEPPSPAERLHLAWALAWPCALLDLVWLLLRGQLRLPQAQLQSIDELVGILGFFLFATWVVRRIVRLDFPGFHLLLVRAAGQNTRTMSYQESLSVAWLIGWRTSLFILPPYAAALALHQQPQEWANTLPGWLLAYLAQFLLFYFWIIRAALGKGYFRFSLRLERSAPENA